MTPKALLSKLVLKASVRNAPMAGLRRLSLSPQLLTAARKINVEAKRCWCQFHPWALQPARQGDQEHPNDLA